MAGWSNVTTHLEYTSTSDSLFSHISIVTEPVKTVDQIQAALPSFESPLVDAFDQIRVLVDRRLVSLALVLDSSFCRVASLLLILVDDLKACVEEIAPEDSRSAWLRRLGQGYSDWGE